MKKTKEPKVPELPLKKPAQKKGNDKNETNRHGTQVKPKYPKVLNAVGTIGRDYYESIKDNEKAMRSLIEKEVTKLMMAHIKPWPWDPKWDSKKYRVKAKHLIVGLRYETEGHINSQLTFSRADGASLDSYEAQIFNNG